MTKEEYQTVGSKALVNKLEVQLREGGLNPYCIAVGGSTPLGAALPPCISCRLWQSSRSIKGCDASNVALQQAGKSRVHSAVLSLKAPGATLRRHEN